MKKREFILIVLFFVSGILYYIFANSISPIEDIRVLRVVDGDTLELENSMKIRLLGINTPEKNMLHSELAVNYLKNTILNKTVQIETIETDKYARMLSYVFYEGQNINEQIVKKGYAHAYYYGKDKYYNDIMEAEKLARESEIGIWKKSPNNECLELVELLYDDDKYGEETLTLENNCNKTLNLVIKDDATHIYKRTLNEGIYTEKFSHIFNDAGDTLFIWDDLGLVEFYRY